MVIIIPAAVDRLSRDGVGRKPKLTDHQRKEAIRRRDAGEETLAEIGRTDSIPSPQNIANPTVRRSILRKKGFLNRNRAFGKVSEFGHWSMARFSFFLTLAGTVFLSGCNFYSVSAPRPKGETAQPEPSTPLSHIALTVGTNWPSLAACRT